MRTDGGVEVGRELERFVADVAARNPELVAVARVRQAWQAVAGAAILGHTDGVYGVPGTGAAEIVVYVDTQLLATELNMQSELLRLRLNVELAGKAHGSAGEEGTPSGGGDALFDFEEREHVRRLSFSPSKERYRNKERDFDEEAAQEDGERVEPRELSAEELRRLEELAAQVEDEGVRAAAFAAAKAHFELEKGRRAS